MLTQELVLNALRYYSETPTVNEDGTVWKEVYIQDIQYLGACHEIAGFLFALKREGLYHPLSKQHGKIRMG